MLSTFLQLFGIGRDDTKKTYRFPLIHPQGGSAGSVTISGASSERDARMQALASVNMGQVIVGPAQLVNGLAALPETKNG